MPAEASGVWKIDCRVRVSQPNPETQTVTVSDMGFEVGWFNPSIVERLIEEVIANFRLDPAKVIWIEEYSTEYREMTATKFSQVTFEWQNGKATNLEWEAIAPEAIPSLVHRGLELVSA